MFLATIDEPKPAGRTLSDLRPPPITPTTFSHAAGHTSAPPLERCPRARCVATPMDSLNDPHSVTSWRGGVATTNNRRPVPSENDIPAGFSPAPFPVRRRPEAAEPQKYRDPGVDTHDMMRGYRDSKHTRAGVVRRGSQQYYNMRVPPKISDLEKWAAMRAEEARKKELREPAVDNC